MYGVETLKLQEEEKSMERLAMGELSSDADPIRSGGGLEGLRRSYEAVCL
jgi:hypothetical protein